MWKTLQIYAVQDVFLILKFLRQQQLKRKRLSQKEAERKRIQLHKFNMFSKHWPIRSKISRLIWEHFNQLRQRPTRSALKRLIFTWDTIQNHTFANQMAPVLDYWRILMPEWKLKKMSQNRQSANGLLTWNLSLLINL